MFKRILIGVALLAALRSSAQVRHVVLISIDGFYPDMYLDPSWPCPNLRELMKNGTYADYLKSVFPSYTYPSHTAMITGALPARSGIYFNQPLNDHSGAWNWYANSIKAPTLWQALKQEGMTTAAVLWPVTVGAEITWNVPDVWPIANPADRATVTKQYATPGLMQDLEQNATGKLDSSTYNEDHLSLDGQSGRIAAYIFKTKHPNLLAVHLIGCDDMEHEYGRDADSVRIAFASVVHAIGDILESVQRSGLKDSTAVIIVGDHGFATIKEAMRPNLLIKNIPAKFVSTGGSAFLYAQVKSIEFDSPEKRQQVNREILRGVTDSLNKLPEAKRKLFRIIDRAKLDRMGADSSALLALSGTNASGLVFSGATTAAKTTNHGPGTLIQQSKYAGVFYPVHGGHHGYDPDNAEMHTGFIACGAGILKGGHIDHLSEPDIAVLIRQLLGIDFKTPDGKPVPGILNTSN